MPEMGYFSAYRHMAAENPDLLLFLGDYIYECTYPPAYADRIARKHDGPTASDLVGYRNRSALYRSDPDLQALHAAASCLVTWDDHEVENDYANEWSQDMRVSSEEVCAGGPPPIKPTTSTCRCAREPFRGTARCTFTTAIASATWRRSLCWMGANTAPSSRAKFRRRGEDTSPRRSCAERVDPQRTLLGFDQERWLFDGFKGSESAWNIWPKVNSLRT